MIDFEFDDLEMVEEPETVYSANRELNIAWDIIENTGSNLFLTGKAGTGKTTFLKRLKRDSKKNMAVLAPTGVAAINAAGSTIHSFFQFPFSPFIPGKGFINDDKKFFKLNKMKRKVIASLSLLVIDEISMVRPDVLDAIDHILRRVRNTGRPFGGVQLLLIGDLRQLSPVVKEEEWQLLNPYYNSPYFFDSLALKNAGYKSIELTTVFRQSDRHFLDILNKIREGRLDLASLQSLNTRCYKGLIPENTDGYIRLTTHNYRADKINSSKLDSLPGKEWMYEAEISGQFPEYAYPADKELFLKEGAQVMFIKNDNGAERKYYNGMIGTVVSLSDEKIRVKPLNSNQILDVYPVVWDNLVYEADETTGEIKQKEAGNFEQFPLKLAWAITIHKSQGLTFQKAIIDAAYSFAAGQTYVALSRCTSLDGILLETPLSPQSIIIDKEANDFINYCEANAPSQELVEDMKRQYVASLFCDLFDFNRLKLSLDDFLRVVFEYVVPVFPEAHVSIRQIEDLWNNHVMKVAAKFIASQNLTELQEKINGSDKLFTQRIKNGCSYFLGQLSEMKSLIDTIPLDIENQGFATRLRNSYDTLKNLMVSKMTVLRYMAANEFSIDNYLIAERHSFMEIAQTGASANPRGKKELVNKPPKEKRQKGYSTFETLKLFRAGKGIEEIASERNLADSTICYHLEQLVNMGQLRIEEIADIDTIKNVKEICDTNKELNFSQLLELVGSSLPDNVIHKTLIKLLR